MDESVVQNPEQKKRFKWRTWLITGIVLILVITAVAYAYLTVKKNQNIRERQIEIMKQYKCMSECPDFQWPQQECLASCNKFVKTGVIEEGLIPFWKGFAVPCNDISKSSNASWFKSCVSQKLQEYSYIINLSGVNISAT